MLAGLQTDGAAERGRWLGQCAPLASEGSSQLLCADTLNANVALHISGHSSRFLHHQSHLHRPMWSTDSQRRTAAKMSTSLNNFMTDVTNEKLLALPGGLVTPNSASQAWCEFLLSLTPPEDQQRPPPSLVFVALAVLSGRSRLLRPS